MNIDEFKQLLFSINEKNNNIIFDKDKMSEIIGEYLLIINELNLIYLNHGGSCICFVNSDYTQVYKLLIKTPQIKNFIEKSKLFDISDIDYLCVNKIIIETENYLIYTQDYCNIIREVRTLFMSKLAHTVVNMLNNNIIVPDIYYFNFGIYKNKIVLYDYHEILNLNDIDVEVLGFFVNNFILNLAAYHNLHNYSHKNIREIVNKLDPDYDDKLNLLCDFTLDKNFEKMIEIFNYFLSKFQNSVQESFNIYQKIYIDKHGVINLYDHTYNKLNFIVKNLFCNIDLNQNYSLLDAGCCIGGIGLKINQMYHNIQVTLNNITISEINTCEHIRYKCYIDYGCTINCDNITQLETKYDITLYLALLHHIIKKKSFDSVISMIKKQTKNYAIIELPIWGDKLLNKVIEETEDSYFINYRHLISLDTLLKKLSQNFTIMAWENIDYGTNDLIRYIILCKI